MIFKIISKFEDLKDLIYCNNTIKKSAGATLFFEALKGCGKNLSNLKIKSCSYSNLLLQPSIDAFSSSFSVMYNLKVLNFGYSNLNDQMCLGLVSNMPIGLTKLNLKHCCLTS